MSLTQPEITTLTAKRTAIQALISAYETARTAAAVPGIPMDTHRMRLAAMERKAHEMLIVFDSFTELFREVYVREYEGALLAEAMAVVAPYIPHAHKRRNVILIEFDTVRGVRARLGLWDSRTAATAYEVAVFAVGVFNTLLA